MPRALAWINRLSLITLWWSCRSRFITCTFLLSLLVLVFYSTTSHNTSLTKISFCLSSPSTICVPQKFLASWFRLGRMQYLLRHTTFDGGLLVAGDAEANDGCCSSVRYWRVNPGDIFFEMTALFTLPRQYELGRIQASSFRSCVFSSSLSCR